MYWQVPKIWKDETCFILGGGSSLLSQFEVPEDLISEVKSKSTKLGSLRHYFSPLEAKHVIAVNMSYRLGNFVDILFFGDTSYYRRNRIQILRDFKGLKVTCMNNINYIKDGVKYLVRDKDCKQLGISEKPAAVRWGYNSGAAAINLAYHLGVKRIVLLGFDMCLGDNNNQHWHGLYAKRNIKTIQSVFDRHKQAFPAIAKDAERLGIEILNCSPISTITEFKKVSLKDVL